VAEYTGAEGVRRFNEEAPWGRFPSMIGLEMLDVERDRVRGRLETTDQLIAGTGYLWAPVIVGLADALCAAGTGANLPEGATFTTVELKTNFLGSARPGEVVVGEAVPPQAATNVATAASAPTSQTEPLNRYMRSSPGPGGPSPIKPWGAEHYSSRLS